MTDAWGSGDEVAGLVPVPWMLVTQGEEKKVRRACRLPAQVYERLGLPAVEAEWWCGGG